MKTEASTPPIVNIQLSQRRFRFVLAAMMLGLLLSALDQTIVATALPTIVGDLHGGSHLAWVVTAYLLASTVSMPIWGKLGDQYGRKTFFQAAIVLFLVGSIFSGFAGNMTELIAFRALQGLGGGGLMVGAQSLLGDLVSPRERGKYQGLFSAIFALASIAGPLLGGLFVQDLTWRWIFYINIPLAAIAFTAIAICVPGHLSKVPHVIDYLGMGILTLAVTALVLLTSLGGTTFSWNSAPIYILGACAVALFGIWISVERRAVEPVLPLHLFKNKAFSVACSLGFVMGLMMFGTMTFLPLYMQDVRGESPTVSGLRLLPLMGGYLVMSIIGGQVISRTGRYKYFPVVGLAFVVTGLTLLSHLKYDTGFWAIAGYVIMLGIGLGCVLQVLVLSVQNAVPRNELGVATSSITFARTIGGTFGTAAFGAIFSNVIAGRLFTNLKAANISSGSAKAVVKSVTAHGLTPIGFKHLSPAIHKAVSIGFTQSLDRVFTIALPLAVFAFLLAVLLPEQKLKQRTSVVVPDGESDNERLLVSSSDAL